MTNDKDLDQWINIDKIIPNGYKLYKKGLSPLSWYFGFDEENKYAFRIEIPCDYSIVKIGKSSSILIKTIKESKKTIILFSLADNTLKEVFAEVFQDLFLTSKEIQNPASATSLVIDKYEKWCRLFKTGRTPHLTEIQQRGLFGELLYIEKAKLNGTCIQEIIDAWSGPDFGEVDFKLCPTWIEVKTVLNKEDTVIISSVEQLDHPNDGNLVIYKLSKSPQGRSLNEQYRIVYSLIKEEGDLFLQNKFDNILSDFGFIDLPIYDENRYIIIDEIIYIVNNSFPKLHRDVKLTEMKSITYSLILDSLEKWRKQ